MAANTNVKVTSPLLGCNFHLKTTTPLVAVGTVVNLVSDENLYANGKWAMYIQASGVIGNSNYGTVAFTSISCLATSVDGGAGTAYARNGSVAFADQEYGWVYIVKPGSLMAGA